MVGICGRYSCCRLLLPQPVKINERIHGPCLCLVVDDRQVMKELMMQAKTLAEQLFFTTCRIEADGQEESWVGTGFVYIENYSGIQDVTRSLAFPAACLYRKMACS